MVNKILLVSSLIFIFGGALLAYYILGNKYNLNVKTTHQNLFQVSCF